MHREKKAQIEEALNQQALALGEISLPGETSTQTLQLKASEEKIATTTIEEPAKIMYDLEAGEPISTVPVKPPQPEMSRGRMPKSSSKSSRSSSESSGSSSSTSRSPPRKRSSPHQDSDTELKKEKKVVEVRKELLG